MAIHELAPAPAPAPRLRVIDGGLSDQSAPTRFGPRARILAHRRALSLVPAPQLAAAARVPRVSREVPRRTIVREASARGAHPAGSVPLRLVATRAAASLVLLGVCFGAGLGLGKLAAPEAPASTHVYTVQPGDTLWGVAATTPGGATPDTVATIRQLNGLNGSTIEVGQTLRLPQ